MIKFEDVMFDTEPLELAEELTGLAEALDIIICTDEAAEAGAEIYFGIPAEIGEIIEVRGTVSDTAETGDDEYEITVNVTAVDAELKNIAIATLTGATADTGSGQPLWAKGIKQQNNTYAILANSPGGMLTAEQLAVIARLSAAGAGAVKLTHAQRIVLLVNADQVEEAVQQLEAVGLNIGVLHHGIRNVRACSGPLCRFNQQTDSITLAQEVADRLFGRTTAFDIKIALSDCMRNCSECYCADIGLIAEKGTYKVVVGGRGSQVPFRALNLASGIKPEAAADFIEKIVDWYISTANDGERLHKLLLRLGSEDKVNLTNLETEFAQYNDGVDEIARLTDQFTRSNGLKKLKAALNL